MNPIEAVDLKKVSEQAQKAFAKIAEGRVIDYLRGLKVQQHNLAMKAARLLMEHDQAVAAQRTLADRIAAIEKGDWNAIEPFELKEQTPKEEPK